MKSPSGRSLVRLSLVGLAVTASPLVPLVTSPLSAQTGAIVQAVPQTGAVERLNQNLNRLSRQPTDMDALIGAGEASYQLGDAQAANGFFMRADMVNARDGRVKLGLALVSVALKQPREAAAYFDEAEALGARADNHMFERALTYDLTGQQDKAQADYLLALRSDPGNSVLIRAYAVSLGISGKLDAAEAQLRPLLYKSDRSAWRDRTMILAMNGRTTEARRVAQTIMPRALADSMDPYLIRMGSLTPAQKAAATHYGQFPADGLRLATVTAPPATPRVETASASTSSRRRSRDNNRDKGKTPAPSPAAPPEDSSLIAAMPHADMPPALVQPLPPSNSAYPGAAPVVVPAAGPVSRPGSGNDDPDGWTAVEQSRANRRIVPTLPGTMRTTMAPTDPSTTSATVGAFDGSRAWAVPNSAGPGVGAVVTPGAVPLANSARSAGGVAMAGAVPVAARPVSGGPVSSPAVPVAAPQRAPATPTAAAVAQAVSPAAPIPTTIQGPPADLGARPDSPQPAATEAAPAAAPQVAMADTAPQPGFSTPPVAGEAPVKPPRTLAAIMADIKVSEEERAAPTQVVDLEEVARLQAAKRKVAADKAKKDAVAKAKAEADAKAKAEAKAEAEEKARLKANPERTWVQVATGRDVGALAFDMRRLRKTYSVLAGEDGWTAQWGATRRLLIGPFAPAKAKTVVTDLKKAGSDGFVWQSEAGETVSALSGK